MSFLQPRVIFPPNFASLLHHSVMKHNSSVVFHPNLYVLFDKRSPSKFKFSYFRLLAWKFLMSFFKRWVSFPLNFASLFSVMTHNSSAIFYGKHYMLCTKRAHQCTSFQSFECSNESSPNSSCNFWNRKVRVYSSFASLWLHKR